MRNEYRPITPKEAIHELYARMCARAGARNEDKISLEDVAQVYFSDQGLYWDELSADERAAACWAIEGALTDYVDGSPPRYGHLLR
jgi:hypothetical protein